jgi:hypothetical protein
MDGCRAPIAGTLAATESPDTVTIGGYPGKLAHQRRSHADAKRRLRHRERDEEMLLQFPVRKATLKVLPHGWLRRAESEDCDAIEHAAARFWDDACRTLARRWKLDDD